MVKRDVRMDRRMECALDLGHDFNDCMHVMEGAETSTGARCMGKALGAGSERQDAHAAGLS